MKVYPLKFRPIYKKRIWGGQKLREVFNKDIPLGVKIGESWELADLPDDKSIVVDGVLAGQNLGEVIKKFPQDITGEACFSQPFPLLIKLLDTQDILSIQVHPDRQSCLRLGEGEPKTECWYIISAEPGAYIYKGLKRGVTKSQFVEAVKLGGVTDLLVKMPVEAGQCHYLPAGTVHSIGPGLLIVEIQTPSDTTYRIFDFDRLDENGRERQLHLRQAIESIHFDTAGDELPVTTEGRLVKSEFFTIDKYHQGVDSEQTLSQGQMRILIVVTGCGTLLGCTDCAVEFSAGDCMLIPAACQTVMQFTDDTQYLIVEI